MRAFLPKNKQLVKAQYQACKMEINYKDKIRSLQDQLESFHKGLKEEHGRVKQLEVTLTQRQSELDKRFEEIRELKDQAHNNLEDVNQLKQETTHWESHIHHLRTLLD